MIDRTVAFRMLAGAGTLALLAGCSEAADSATADEANLRQGRTLQIEQESSLPIHEVSGLAQTGGDHFLAVGDVGVKVVSFTLDDRGDSVDEQELDLSDLVDAPDEGSQWEAIEVDGAGRVFVMSEMPSEIHVFDGSLTKLLHTMVLDVPKDSAAFDSWSTNVNSHGEGMVLLDGGHVLVAIEKDPPSLGEFGPAGDSPLGYSPGSARDVEAFDLPEGSTSTLELLHQWTLKDDERGILKDISEIAIGPEQRLYLMTQEGRAIVGIEKTLDPTEDKIDIKTIDPLPSSLETAEGLVILGDRGVLVAQDVDAAKKDSFLLSPIPTVSE